jgi:hypothetical protein
VRSAAVGRLVLALGASAVLTTVVALGLVPSASAAPLKAKFKPLPSRAVTKTISAAQGGTLSLTAPGRIRIVVKIPRGALLADTNVTATPITRFRVAPVHGGFVAGVQLAPEGLELLKPGSIEFRPRKGLRPTRRYFLGSQGNGSDVHLAPPAFRKLGRGRKAKLRVVSKPIVPILHFSTVEGFDWSKVNLRDLDAIRFPQSEIDGIQHNIAKLLEVERQKQFIGFGEELSAYELGLVLERVRDREIKPRLAVVNAALTRRCSAQAVRNGRAALMLALVFVRQEQLLGLPDSFDTAALMGPLLKGIANCMLQQCAKYGPRIFPFLAGTAVQVELIGADAREAFFAALFKNLVACSKGEVHLDSTINEDDDDGQGFSEHYTMRVVGRASFEGSPDLRGFIYKEAPLEYQDVHGSSQLLGGECGVFYRDTLQANSNGVFRINVLNFRPFSADQPDISGPIENLSLTITQDPTEYQNVTNDCSGQFPSHVTNLWVSFFGQNHPALRAPFFNGPEFFPEAAPVIALATYTNTRPAGGSPTATLSENTLLEVISKPGPIEPLPNPFGEPN